MEKTLNLDEFIAEDVEIQALGKKYQVTARIPRKLFLKFIPILTEFSNGSIQEKTFHDVNDLIVDILALKNNRNDVVNMLNDIDITSWNKIVKFIVTYISESVSDDKKKTD